MRQLLAARNRASKNIWIAAIIVAELKFRDVQRQIFTAYLVIAAHDAALNQRPETLNRVGVDRADDMLTSLMVDGTMRIFAAKMVIDRDRRQCKAS